METANNKPQILCYILLFWALAIAPLVCHAGTIKAAYKCIAAGDFGLGGQYYIFANPDEENQGPTKLIKSAPKNQQVAPWVDTGLMTIGKVNEGSSVVFPALVGSVTGGWYPWGGDRDESCNVVGCNQYDSAHAVCMDGGIVASLQANMERAPCYLDRGIGLYGLVALPAPNGQYGDPNELANISLPSSLFRTFHINPYIKAEYDNMVTFSVPYTQICSKVGTQTSCLSDEVVPGTQQIVKGKLYLKIYDRHYNDNAGYYTVNILGGVYGVKGLIQQAIESFTKTMKKVTNGIYEAITTDTKFISLVQSLLLFYIALQSILFLFGITQIN